MLEAGLRVLPFQALVFDVGGVTIPHDNDLLYRRLAARCRATDALVRIVDAAHDSRYGTGELPIADLHRRLRDELGYDRDWPGFQLDWSSHLAVDPAMLELVQDLATRNRVLLFSNTNREHWGQVRALTGGAIDQFETYLSHDIGMVKPDVAAFHLVAARAGIDPARCLFIDDGAGHVAGARLAGFTAHHFIDQAGLEAYLAGT